jgi:hypothetical protein
MPVPHCGGQSSPALPWSFVSKITNSKHQISNKSQIPNLKFQTRAKTNFYSFVCYLFFRSRAAQALAPRVGIYLLFVFCYLGFPLSVIVIWNLIYSI